MHWYEDKIFHAGSKLGGPKLWDWDLMLLTPFSALLTFLGQRWEWRMWVTFYFLQYSHADCHGVYPRIDIW